MINAEQRQITMTSTTQTTLESPSNIIHTTLNYQLDPSEGGSSWFGPFTVHSYRRKFNEKAVQVRDIGGHEDDFELHRHGFQLVAHTSKEKDFDDVERIMKFVYPEMEELLKAT